VGSPPSDRPAAAPDPRAPAERRGPGHPGGRPPRIGGRRLGGTTRRGGEDGGEQGRLQPGDRQCVPVPIQDKPGTIAQTPRAAAAPLPRRRAITALLVPT